MSDDRPTAVKVGVFNYKCKRGHWVCSNNPDLGTCEWPGCGVAYDDDDECWVQPFEYLRVKAEVERLRVPDTILRKLAQVVEVEGNERRAAALVNGWAVHIDADELAYMKSLAAAAALQEPQP